MKSFIIFFSFLVVALAAPHNQNGRIINGHSAVEGQFPYMVFMLDPKETQYCNGVIIDPQWILTTANCALMAAHLGGIVAGTYLNNGMSGTMVLPAQVIINEGFNKETTENDIALIKIDQELVYDDNIQPIELGEVGNDENCTIMGWGTTLHMPYPFALQYTEETTIDLVSCINMVESGLYYLGEKTICAVGANNVTACIGDIGGPLVCGGKLAGLINSAYMVCNYNGPDVFTRVFEYTQWIDSKLGKKVRSV